jgi:integrase
VPKAPIRLQDAIDAYLESRKARGFAAGTIKNDRHVLDALLVSAGNILVRSLAAKHIETLFQEHIDTWGDGTRQLRLASLRAFFRWCRQQGYLPRDFDPTGGWRMRRAAPDEHLRIPAARFGDLLDATNHARDRIFIALGLYLFLRSSEITSLKIKDVDLDRGRLRVHVHKTRDFDVMPIPTELDEELRTWLKWYAEHHGELDPEWYLVPAKSSAPVKGVDGVCVADLERALLRPRRMFAQPFLMVRAAVERLGYPGHRVGGHTLRRSGARAYFDHLGNQGYDRALQRVRAMLHHSTSTMTELYLGITVERHQRDESLRGQLMFPELRADNVISFKGVAAGGRAGDQGV